MTAERRGAILGDIRKKRLWSTLRSVLSDQVPVVRWYYALPNWGDALSPKIVELIAGVKPVGVHEIVNIANRRIFAVIGSILDYSWYPRLEVWGSGFIRQNSTCRVPPARVHAVRGPLTRATFVGMGIPCPEIYGDPALLYPRYYQPAFSKEYRIGIVPHHADRESPLLQRFRGDPNVNVIDVFSDIDVFVDEIARCEFIVSSSLHGIIAADAYGIPSARIILSDGLIGGDFKFDDYCLGVHRPIRPGYRVTDRTRLPDLISLYEAPRLDVDLDALLDACPFRPAT